MAAVFSLSLLPHQSAACKIDPALGRIDGSCLPDKTKITPSSAVFLYIPGTEGVADFATMRVVSPASNPIWFLSTLLETTHIGISVSTSALPRVQACMDNVSKKVRTLAEYQQYCVSPEAVSRFEWTDAHDQVERALDSARGLAKELDRPLVIFAISHGCNHVAKLVRDGLLRDDPLVLMNCAGESIRLTAVLQASKWTHWNALQRHGMGNSLAELKSLRLRSENWREIIPKALVDNAMSYCQDMRLSEENCQRDQIGQSIFVEALSQLSLLNQIDKGDLEFGDYNRLWQMLGQYSVPRENLNRLIFGDKDSLKMRLEMNSWYKPSYMAGLLQQDAAYRSLVGYLGSITYLTSDWDPLVPQQPSYCSSESPHCRDVVLDACLHELPSGPGSCASQLLREIRYVLGSEAVPRRTSIPLQ
ncbi:hypothetical protein ACG0Z6_14125 [Roseateles sp. BYS180W]|uniref:Alpha/beta hydrolase n=1 Tax=Roseateles rivi TaxID=3299028 RepID=A0ABW7FYH0_9BURK